MTLHPVANNRELIEQHNQVLDRIGDDVAAIQDKAYDVGYAAGQAALREAVTVAVEFTVDEIVKNGFAYRDDIDQNIHRTSIVASVLEQVTNQHYPAPAV